ncbi:DUF11 domain-containing protein [Herbivorax sp. ANBcel31]|uniref:DUF11 domain-containing protein n=1 Tax=Herbivorax sp. ANBcel31 TaxID=3069754 RepID=UPI0027B1B395|nr:DUF11 domain-containing protein [Herbivorax sp. ANBcel31]MDQ2086649.1 DUF11 domain-containing protein [Herbivorax sp. ANBcel31]
MFPISDNQWIIYTSEGMPIIAPANDVNPCATDIVGNVTFPSLYYFLNPIGEEGRDICFRMRLNQSPLRAQDRFFPFAWGVELVFAGGLNYTVFINSRGAADMLQVINPFGSLVYNVPIVLGDNVRVIRADSEFPCAVNPDPDFFLDFKVPISSFQQLNLDTSVYRFCYFTATQDQSQRKEYLCGDLVNMPQMTLLTVEKEIVSGPLTIDKGVLATWVLKLTITNTTSVDAINVVLEDTINSDIANTLSISLNATLGTASYSAPKVIWNVGNIEGLSSESIEITITAKFDSQGHKILDSAIAEGINTTPAGPVADSGIVVTEPDAPVFTLTKSLTGPLEIDQAVMGSWTVELTVENVSNVTVENLVVYDQLNNQLKNLSVNLSASTGSASIVDYDITWEVGNLNPGQQETLTIEVEGIFYLPGQKTFNIAKGTSDNAPEVDSVHDKFVVVNMVMAELSIIKNIVSGPVSPQTIDVDTEYTWVFEITVTNITQTNITAENVVVTDVLNSELGIIAPESVVLSKGSYIYDAGTSTLTWEVGSIDQGDSETITVEITGEFTSPGFKFTNFANASADNALAAGPVLDKGVMVSVPLSFVQITKGIIEGPLISKVCQNERWKLLIEISNLSQIKAFNVVVMDQLNGELLLEEGFPSINVTKGDVSIDFEQGSIMWDVGHLEAGETEQMEINLLGYFVNEGLQVINTAMASGGNVNPTELVSDEGVEVKPIYHHEKTGLYGKVVDASTGMLLNDVKVNIYDSTCKIIEQKILNGEYFLNLLPGIYTVEFIKEGYHKKFILPVLFTDIPIRHDVFLNSVERNVGFKDFQKIFRKNIDLFAAIIKERIHAEIVFANVSGINKNFDVEDVSDVIDKLSFSVCGKKLRLKILIEKNIVYKHNGNKNMISFLKEIYGCIPLEGNFVDYIFEKNYKITDKKFCSDQCNLYNFATIKFKGYFIERGDVLISDKE